MHSSADRRAIPVYLLATWTASTLFYFLIIKSTGSNAASGAYVDGLMWSPGIGALLTCRYLGRPIAGIHPKQTAEAFTAFFGLGPLSRATGIGLYLLVVGTVGVIQNCATTLGEEIRWRGLLVPELSKRFSFTATSILSGLIWALWHMPIIAFAGYNMGTGWYGMVVVTANMIVLSFVMAWLQMKSGSLWTAVILHASSNHFIQHFFDPMTAYTGNSKYILGEFGIGFTVVVGALAGYFWSRRAELDKG